MSKARYTYKEMTYSADLATFYISWTDGAYTSHMQFDNTEALLEFMFYITHEWEYYET